MKSEEQHMIEMQSEPLSLLKPQAVNSEIDGTSGTIGTSGQYSPLRTSTSPQTPLPGLNATIVKTVPLSERNTLEYLMILFGGSILAFNAGFVNGCTILYTKSPSSHVTGLSTYAGLALGDGKGELLGHYLAVIVCFVFGSGITGAILPDAPFQFSSEIGPLLIVGSFLFLAASLCALYAPETEFDIYFAAMGCGLQNGLTTKYSGNLIRTTHMTGTATDIGLILGKMVMGDWKDLWKLKLLASLFFSFVLGGVLSVVAFEKTGGGLALVINFIFFLVAGVTYSVVISKKHRVPFWRTLLGCYENNEHVSSGVIPSVLVGTSENPMHGNGLVK